MEQIWSHPLTLVIVGFVLTGLVGTGLTHFYNVKQKEIEFRRDKNQREIEAQRQRNDKIVAQQFEVVESLTKIAFDYFHAAWFVVLDFQEGQPEQDLLRRHLTDYDRTARETLSGYLLTTFKVRMYFNDPITHNELRISWQEIAALDRKIVKELNLQKNVPTPTIKNSKDPWVGIGHGLDLFLSKIEVKLDSLYKKVGKQGVAEETQKSPKQP